MKELKSVEEGWKRQGKKSTWMEENKKRGSALYFYVSICRSINEIHKSRALYSIEFITDIFLVPSFSTKLTQSLKNLLVRNITHLENILECTKG